MAKTQRNELCPCNSGLKFKKCCMNQNQDKHNNFNANCSTKELMEFMKLALENLSIAGNGQKNIRIKEIKVLNLNTLECQFYADHNNIIDVKTELSSVIGAIYGFLRDDFFKNGKFNYYAARAFNEGDEEIQYVISPLSAAKQIAEGNSIEWLKSSVFQENTPDYRLGIAKRQISEIEKGLRSIIITQLGKHGSDWFNQFFDNKLGKQIKDTYENQFGETTNDGSVLIEYSFILQLKKLICTCWKDFRDVFPNKIEFENAMTELNRIRREESHNREISQKDLQILNELYGFFLLPISKHQPNIVPTYLVDNWKSKLKEIMFEQIDLPYSDEDIENEIDSDIKIEKLSSNLTEMAEYVEHKIELIKSIVVPVQKIDTHNELIELLSRQSMNHRDFVKFGHERNAEALQIAVEERDIISKKIKDFTENYIVQES